MSIDEKVMLQAVYDAIFDPLTVAPVGAGGGQPIVPKNLSYLSVCLPGMPVDVTQFANPWQPNNPDGSVQAAENFAKLVDVIPEAWPVYAYGNSLDTTYGEIVHANVNPPPPDPAGEAAYKAAEEFLYVNGTDYDQSGKAITVRVPGPSYLNYQRLRKVYQDALLNYMAAYLSYNLKDPDQARKWQILGPIMRGNVDSAWDSFQGSGPGKIEESLATIGQYQQSTRVRIFADARRQYEMTRKAMVSDPNQYWHSCDAFPGNWYAEQAAENFTSITINSDSLRYNEESRFRKFAATSGMDFGVWRIKGPQANAKEDQTSIGKDTSGMSVSMRLGRVEIRRPWLNFGLLSMTGWSVASAGPGQYSNGDILNLSGKFPLLCTSFLVARDVKISAKWGQEDLQKAAYAVDASYGTSWGPFRLSGSFENTGSTNRYRSEFDGTTLAVPGIQIIGWLSSVVPYSPPIDGPKTVSGQAVEDGWRQRNIHNPYHVSYAMAGESETARKHTLPSTAEPAYENIVTDGGQPQAGYVSDNEPVRSVFVRADL